MKSKRRFTPHCQKEAAIILLVSALVGGCGSAAASAPTVTPLPVSTTSPTPIPLPTAYFTPLAQWKSTMVTVTGQLRRVSVELRTAGADLASFEAYASMGHLQDAKDALVSARQLQGSVTAPPAYAYMNWLVGQSLAKYADGIDTISAAIANNDVGQFYQGIAQLQAGRLDLLRADSAFYHPTVPTPLPHKLTGPSKSA